MKRIIAAGAALALFLPAAAVLAQQPSKGKDAPAKAAAPPATAARKERRGTAAVEGESCSCAEIGPFFGMGATPVGKQG